MSLTIHLERFEGPLGLLLYLIRKDEMDIFDIDIHLITRQYLDYIKAMKKLDLEVAGEFIAMASTLIQIKSKMLLPQYNEEGEVIEDDKDPRKELVQKLLEYQKYQEVSQKLYERPLLGRDVWLRGKKLNIEAAEGDIIVEENPLFSLIKSFRFVLKSAKKKTHRVFTELQSIAERILEIKDKLRVGDQVLFKNLIDKSQSKEAEGLAGQVLITFLSILELGKLGFVSLFQTESCGDIYIQAKKPIERNVIDRVEEYETEYVDQEESKEFFEKPENLETLTIENTEEPQQMTLSEQIDEESDDFEEGVTPTLFEADLEPVEETNVDAATDAEIEEAEKELNIFTKPLTDGVS